MLWYRKNADNIRIKAKASPKPFYSLGNASYLVCVSILFYFTFLLETASTAAPDTSASIIIPAIGAVSPVFAALFTEFLLVFTLISIPRILSSLAAIYHSQTGFGFFQRRRCIIHFLLVIFG